MGKKPNLFIIGAPRTGTTALYEYLKDHPKIFMAYIKESWFFATDYPDNYRDIRDLNDYEEMFENSIKEHVYLGEGTTGYLRSEAAIRNIYEYNKDAKIIIMVRNPIDIAYSQYQRMLYRLYETNQDFEAAWELQDERSKGYNIPITCRKPENLQYRKIGSIGTQIKKVLTIFPKEQVKIIFFEDFIGDTLKVYKDIMKFLQLEYDGRTDFPKINESVEVKYKLLQVILNLTFLKNIGKFIFKTLNIDRNVISDILIKVKLVKAEKKKIPQEIKQKLNLEFYCEIEIMEQITDRNLSHWYIRRL